MTIAIILLTVGTLAYANGANDNFKGVATLFGSETTNYHGALTWATVTTLFGSLTAVFLAEKLLHTFKGKGLVDAVLVAETMSHRITQLNHGQGFTANAISGLIIIGASRFGMPVSTTHVSCGALFGIGSVTGSAHWKTIGTIMNAWITTLPAGAILGGISYWFLHGN